MEYAIVSVPAAAVRRKPRHQRELTNQLLFGETVKVLKEKNALWVKIRSLHDNYEGWVTKNLLQEITEAEARQPSTSLSSGFVNTIKINESTMHLPMGASLPNIENGSGHCGSLHFSFDGQMHSRMNQPRTGELLEQLARQWLNAPYLWGGRTLFGVDCSGFVQVNFKMMGIDLPRDAWQQAQEGKGVKKLKLAQKGDLAFFDDREEIVHVGILLSSEQIIHASGKVRVDQIDKAGIINSDTGKRTHQLKSIRRYW